MLVTDIGSSFHDIMNLFGKTRDNAEKKRIGSDMTNSAMGHLIRGKFCSALARLLLDGLRPYHLQGIMKDDIWDVMLAFIAAMLVKIKTLSRANDFDLSTDSNTLCWRCSWGGGMDVGEVGEQWDGVTSFLSTIVTSGL